MRIHGERLSRQYLYNHVRSLVSDLCLEGRFLNDYKDDVNFASYDFYSRVLLVPLLKLKLTVPPVIWVSGIT